MMKINEMMNRYYGIKDLFGSDVETKKKAWKATGIATIIYAGVIGVSVFVDKVFEKRYTNEIKNYEQCIDNSKMMSDEKKLELKKDFRENTDLELKIVTGTIGTVLGIIGSICMFKVLKKK